jgi:hypothetical protein
VIGATELTVLAVLERQETYGVDLPERIERHGEGIGISRVRGVCLRNEIRCDARTETGHPSISPGNKRIPLKASIAAAANLRSVPPMTRMVCGTTNPSGPTTY